MNEDEWCNSLFYARNNNHIDQMVSPNNPFPQLPIDQREPQVPAHRTPRWWGGQGQWHGAWCMLRIPILPIIKLPFNQVHLLKWTHDNQPISYPRLTLANERQQNPNCRNLNRQTYVMFSINMQRRLHTCDGRPTRKKKSTIVARN